jgi:hypothetical protein
MACSESQVERRAAGRQEPGIHDEALESRKRKVIMSFADIRTYTYISDMVANTVWKIQNGVTVGW